MIYKKYLVVSINNIEELNDPSFDSLFDNILTLFDYLLNMLIPSVLNWRAIHIVETINFYDVKALWNMLIFYSILYKDTLDERSEN